MKYLNKNVGCKINKHTSTATPCSTNEQSGKEDKKTIYNSNKQNKYLFIYF